MKNVVFAIALFTVFAVVLSAPQFGFGGGGRGLERELQRERAELDVERAEVNLERAEVREEDVDLGTGGFQGRGFQGRSRGFEGRGRGREFEGRGRGQEFF